MHIRIHTVGIQVSACASDNQDAAALAPNGEWRQMVRKLTHTVHNAPFYQP